jgi:hypothetical protein
MRLLRQEETLMTPEWLYAAAALVTALASLVWAFRRRS